MEKNRKADFKARTMTSSKDKLRGELLERQKEARRDLQEHTRNLALSAVSQADDDKDDEGSESGGRDDGGEQGMKIEPKGKKPLKSSKVKSSKEEEDEGEHGYAKAYKSRSYYAKQLMYPQWMLELPEDLATNWYVLPRPEGQRCLVTVARGTTVSRSSNGTILHRFPSSFPNGSKWTRERDAYSILDCIFHKPNNTYYVLDIMCWKNFLLYESPSSFRFYWVEGKLAESLVSTATSKNRYRFIQVPYRTCDVAGFRWVYPSLSSTPTTTKPSSVSSRFDFVQDGILFYHAQTQYVQESTPLTLLWKDRYCSPYPLSTNDGTTVTLEHFVSLSLHKDLSVRTLEGDVVGQIASTFSNEAQKDGDLFRFSISGLDTSSDPPKLTDLTYRGRSSLSRTLPDSLSKIVFQVLSRQQEGLTTSTSTSTSSSFMSTNSYRLLSSKDIFTHIESTVKEKKTKTTSTSTASFDLSAFSMVMDTEPEEEEKKEVVQKQKTRGKKKKKQVYVPGGNSTFTPTASYLQRFSSSTSTPMVSEQNSKDMES